MGGGGEWNALVLAAGRGPDDPMDIAARALGGRLPKDVRALPAADSAAASVLRAVEEEGVRPPLLVTTADHALLDGAMLDAFLQGAEEAVDADLAVALVRRQDVLARWPEARRTWLKLGRDRVTSCNLFALRKALSRRLGLMARPVFLPMAEASVDVDKPEDLELAERILKERATGGA